MEEASVVMLSAFASLEKAFTLMKKSSTSMCGEGESTLMMMKNIALMDDACELASTLMKKSITSMYEKSTLMKGDITLVEGNITLMDEAFELASTLIKDASNLIEIEFTLQLTVGEFKLKFYRNIDKSSLLDYDIMLLPSECNGVKDTYHCYRYYYIFEFDFIKRIAMIPFGTRENNKLLDNFLKSLNNAMEIGNKYIIEGKPCPCLSGNDMSKYDVTIEMCIDLGHIYVSRDNWKYWYLLSEHQKKYSLEHQRKY